MPPRTIIQKVHKLYTYGYRAGSIEDLESQMHRLGAVLADVRFQPDISNPTWSRTGLKRRFGNQYVFLKSLGNANYDGKMGFGTYLFNEDLGKQLLFRLLDKSPVIILCACANPFHCHRDVIATKMSFTYGVKYHHLVPGELGEQRRLF